MFTRPDNWNKMSPLERRKARLDAWQNAPVPFISPEAEASYRARVTRFIKVIRLEEPDRVPVMTPATGWCGRTRSAGRRA